MLSGFMAAIATSPDASKLASRYLFCVPGALTDLARAAAAPMILVAAAIVPVPDSLPLSMLSD